MKRFTCFLLAATFTLAAPIAQVYAQEAEAAESATSEIVASEAVMLNYNRALQLIIDDMLTVQDLDVVIRDMDVSYRELRDQVNRTARGDFRREQIQAIHEEIQALESAMFTTMVGQTTVDAQLNQTMNAIAAGMAATGGQGNFETLFNTSSILMATSAELSGAMSSLDSAHTMMWNQLQTLHDDDIFRDLVDELRRSLNELGRQLENVRINQDLIELTMENVFRGLIVAIDELYLAKDSLEAAIELAEENMRRMVVSYEVGIISAHDLRTIEHGLSQLYVQLDDVQRTQDGLRQNLNHMMGLPLSQHTAIEFQRSLPTMPNNLDTHIEGLIANDPTIRQAQFQIDSALAERRGYTGNDRPLRITDEERRRANNIIVGERNDEEARRNERIREARNRINLQDAVDRAVLGREQAERNLDSAIRTAFNDLEALFIQIDVHNSDLVQAQAALEVAEANFAAGRITNFDVEQAKLNVANIEQGMQSIYNQKWILAFRLENPSLLLRTE